MRRSARGDPLGTNLWSLDEANVARRQGAESIQHIRYDSLHHVQMVGMESQKDYGQRLRKIVILREFLVYSNEDVETVSGGSSKQSTVLDALPALLPHCSYVMALKLSSQLTRQALIKQQSHVPTRASVPLRGPSPLVPGLRWGRHPGSHLA